MKIICIGRNYRKHIEELGNKESQNPLLFIKPDTALIQKDRDFYIPEFSKNIHYEIELVVKISKVGKYIQKEFAKDYYHEIALGIDFTARDVQDELKKEGHPWEKAKAFDNSALVGKFVSKENYDLNNINFSLQINDAIVQDSNTKYMMHTVDDLLVEMSKYFTLKTGDLIFTGTPEGVGKLNENDQLIGYLEKEENFRIKIQ